MTDHLTKQYFTMNGNELVFDRSKSILTCKSIADESRKLWAKKLEEVLFLEKVIEDTDKYYVACGIGEHSGRFIALDRKTGVTEWFIPGKSFLQLLYEDYLYLIFVDDREAYYLLKVDRSDGASVWHYRVETDLCEYCFKKNSLTLWFQSGRTETMDIRSGRQRSKQE